MRTKIFFAQTQQKPSRVPRRTCQGHCHSSGHQEAQEAKLGQPEVRFGPAAQRQGSDRLRARRRPQLAGAQHRDGEGRPASRRSWCQVEMRPRRL